MKLDGKTVFVGMQVFDIALGQGLVTSITDGNGMQVHFTSGQNIAYTALGIGAFTNKTLYLSRPEIVAPFGDARDTQLNRTIRSVYQSFVA